MKSYVLKPRTNIKKNSIKHDNYIEIVTKICSLKSEIKNPKEKILQTNEKNLIIIQNNKKPNTFYRERSNSIKSKVNEKQKQKKKSSNEIIEDNVAKFESEMKRTSNIKEKSDLLDKNKQKTPKKEQITKKFDKKNDDNISVISKNTSKIKKLPLNLKGKQIIEIKKKENNNSPLVKRKLSVKEEAKEAKMFPQVSSSLRKCSKIVELNLHQYFSDNDMSFSVKSNYIPTIEASLYDSSPLKECGSKGSLIKKASILSLADARRMRSLSKESKDSEAKSSRAKLNVINLQKNSKIDTDIILMPQKSKYFFLNEEKI